MGKRLFLAIALCCMLCGCASTKRTAFTPLTGGSGESQWELRLADGGGETPLTGALAASTDTPGEGRLYVMLSMGQTLGKCVLSGGGAFCEPSVPGTAPLLQKIATPMARILLEGMSPPRALRGRGWRCDVDGDWLVYREERAKWTLRLRRIQ